LPANGDARFSVGRELDFLFGVREMLSIDADAHVIETEKTWDYLAPVVIDKILCINPARFYGLD
jgi:hypothetical protein